MGVMEPSGAFVDCEIRERNDPQPIQPRPASCDLEWGDRFGVGEAGPGFLGCHGDTVFDPDATMLPYGQAFRFGAILCEASEAGLACRNGQGGGFFLSRARQAVF